MDNKDNVFFQFLAFYTKAAIYKHTELCREAKTNKGTRVQLAYGALVEDKFSSGVLGDEQDLLLSFISNDVFHSLSSLLPYHTWLGKGAWLKEKAAWVR